MLVETVLGNVNEPAWTERLREAKVDDLVLDQWDAQKSRLRRTTSLGTELALSLARGVRLRDGDVLAWDDATATAVVARIALGEVMVVHLDTLHDDTDHAMAGEPELAEPAAAGLNTAGETRR